MFTLFGFLTNSISAHDIFPEAGYGRAFIQEGQGLTAAYVFANAFILLNIFIGIVSSNYIRTTTENRNNQVGRETTGKRDNYPLYGCIRLVHVVLLKYGVLWHPGLQCHSRTPYRPVCVGLHVRTHVRVRIVRMETDESCITIGYVNARWSPLFPLVRGDRIIPWYSSSLTVSLFPMCCYTMVPLLPLLPLLPSVPCVHTKRLYLTGRLCARFASKLPGNLKPSESYTHIIATDQWSCAR